MLNGLKRALMRKVLNDVLKDEVNNMPTNFKTTLLGIAAILATAAPAAIALLHGQPVDWTSVFAGIAAGWGLIAAKDAK